jgi:hypothetical protein
MFQFGATSAVLSIASPLHVLNGPAALVASGLPFWYWRMLDGSSRAGCAFFIRGPAAKVFSYRTAIALLLS